MNRFTFLFCIIITSVVFGQEAVKFKVLNTSVNSRFAELGTRYLDSATVTYASSKKVDQDQAFIKTRRKRQRQLFIAIYKGVIAENGDIVDQGRFLDRTQKHIQLSDFALAPDGKTIYFTWNNYHPYMIDTIENYWSNLRIVKGTINADNEIDIPNAHPLPFVNTKNNYNHVALSPDGNTLYFAADLPKGSGGMDLYKVDILGDDRYSEPVNLGKEINSSQNELFPFVDAANNLYFASYGHRGMGGLDLFKSTLVNGEFTDVIHLDAPINSNADDFGLIVNSATQKGYFTSDREEGKGDVDIYAFEPDLPECVQNLDAIVTNSHTDERLKNVNIIVFDASGVPVNSFFIDHLDSTEIPLFCDSNLTLRIEKDGYKSTEIEVQTGTAYMENIVREIQLEEIPCTQFITGDVLHKLDLSPTTEVQLSLYANDTLVREKFLLNESKFTFEVPCNTKYTLKAEKSGFEAVALPIKTGTGLQEIMGITILLSPRICAQEVQVSLFDTETTLTLSKFKARLLKNGELISEKNIINGNQSSFMLECNTAYTIALEKPGYASSSLEIVTDDSYAVIHERTVNMDALACEQFLKLEGTTATDSEALLTSEFELFRDGISIDVQGSFNKLKIPCNSAVQLKISSPGFEPKIIELNTSNEFDRITEMRVSFIKEVCEQDLKLTVADSQSKAEISNFEMLYQKDGKEVRQFIRSGNSVNVKVKCNTLNRFRIQKENYDILEFTVETNNLKGTALNETVYLTPTVCEQLISGRVLDADSGAALQKALLTITSGNTFSEDLNLDIDGNFSFIAKCEQTYLLKASLVNYSSEQVKFTTSKNNGGQIRKTLNLQREVEITTVAGQRLINTNNIVFELNKTDINMETAIELNKVVALLNKYPDLNLTVKSHTDSRAPDDLSLKLTEERSKAIRSYLVSKGIDPSRIQALGLGESELLNACSNGVKCTEEEHNINRRTEFIIGN